MTSCKPARTTKNSPESTSGKPQSVLAPRRGRAPVPLPAEFEAIHTRYVAQLAKITVFDDDTRVAYASRVRQYLAWLAGTNLDGDPLADPAARDGAVRDYRTHLQTVLKRAPSTINTVLASLADFYTRHGLGPPVAQRLDLPKRAPRALKKKDTTRWLRTVERWLNPRDRVLALIPFYAGLRIGEAVHLDCDDIQLTARKGLIVVRSGKGNHYREVPVHPGLHGDLKLWIEDERPTWRGADTNPALLLNHRGGRLGVRGARDILATIADEAGIDPEFTSHVLRHSFGTNLIRQGHDLVLVAELMGHRRLETVRTYSLPTDEDRQRAINSLPADG